MQKAKFFCLDVHMTVFECLINYCVMCRELKREFVLPEGVDPYDVKSNLMPDGFLRVEAPVGGKPAPKLEQPTPYPDTVSKQETAESVTSDKAESSTSS